VAAKRTAAFLHEAERFQPKSIEVLVEHPARYRRDDVIVHSTRDLPECDITYVGPIPVTTAERTLIDLGAVAPLRRVEHATDTAEREQLIAPEHLAERHRKLRKQGRNGIAIMSEVLADRGPVIPQSTLERDFVRLVADAHLPPPQLQHSVDVDYGRVYIDAAYPDRKKGFEIDGHRWHASQSQRAADNRRQRALADVGWDIRRFTYEEVKRNGPAVVRSVRTALGLGFGDNP
jgi:very-short-patch-repair endonuclease